MVEYRRLGSSGLHVSALCLGTMMFGGRATTEESLAIIRCAVEAGVNFIDTANVYAKGESERIIGRAIKELGGRDSLVVATKCANRVGPGANDEGCSRIHILRECERSLQRMGLDYIDVYYMHHVDLQTPLEETLHTLEVLVRQGKIRYPACSKWPASVLTEAMMLCERHGWPRLVVEQPPYNIVDRRIENEHLRACLRWGLGVAPWAPIAAGLLSGKYAPGQAPPQDARWKGQTEGILGERFTPEALTVANRLKSHCEARNVPMAAFALAWTMRQPGITAPITGPRTVEQMQTALSAVDVPITAEDRQLVNELVPPGAFVANYYDFNFNQPMRAALGL